MNRKTLFLDYLTIAFRLVKYNLKIIFAGKFIFFLAAAMAMFMLIALLNLFGADSTLADTTVYWLLLVPGILLVFYPTVFGIQNDVDARMIEILFGIPNYRYTVWLLRFFIMYLLTFAILMFLAAATSVLMVDIPVLNMTLEVMAPVLFFGSISFMVSTFIANGGGTAVVMIVGGIGVWISQAFIGQSQWNPLINPFNIPQNVNETVWAETIRNNRMFLLAVVAAALLVALLNLQKRERFI